MRTLIFILIAVILLSSGNGGWAQNNFRATATGEVGLIFLPYSEIMEDVGKFSFNYTSLRVGLGYVSPFKSSGNLSWSTVNDVWVKHYIHKKERIERPQFSESSFRASYVGVSSGLRFKFKSLVLELQPFLAYMVHNETILFQNNGEEQRVHLKNKGEYGMNYWYSGIFPSIAITNKKGLPKYEVGVGCPVSFTKIGSGRSDFLNTRWITLIELRLVYNFGWIGSVGL